MFHCVNWSPIEQFIIIQNSTINRPGVDSVVDLLASKKVLDEDNVLASRRPVRFCIYRLLLILLLIVCDDALETC